MIRLASQTPPRPGDIGPAADEFRGHSRSVSVNSWSGASARLMDTHHTSRREETVMASEESCVPEPHVLMSGIAFGESPRWHDGRLWVSDWGAQEVVAVDLDGNTEVMARVGFPSFPMCIEFLPDGSLLIVSARQGLLLRREHDGSLVTYAELSSISGHPWNDIVVDGRGNAYVNNVGFDFPGGEFAPGIIALVTPDGVTRQVAQGFAFPNGIAVTPDNKTLIVAESYAGKLTALDRTVSAWTPTAPSGTQTCPISIVCAFAKAARCLTRSNLTEAASLACSGVPATARSSWWRNSGAAPRTCSAGREPAKS